MAAEISQIIWRWCHDDDIHVDSLHIVKYIWRMPSLSVFMKTDNRLKKYSPSSFIYRCWFQKASHQNESLHFIFIVVFLLILIWVEFRASGRRLEKWLMFLRYFIGSSEDGITDQPKFLTSSGGNWWTCMESTTSWMRIIWWWWFWRWPRWNLIKLSLYQFVYNRLAIVRQV